MNDPVPPPSEAEKIAHINQEAIALADARPKAGIKLRQATFDQIRQEMQYRHGPPSKGDTALMILSVAARADQQLGVKVCNHGSIYLICELVVTWMLRYLPTPLIIRIQTNITAGLKARKQHQKEPNVPASTEAQSTEEQPTTNTGACDHIPSVQEATARQDAVGMESSAVPESVPRSDD